MTWLGTLLDQLPTLLVLSPAMGFLVTLAAAKSERELVRYLAISSTASTLIILGMVFWHQQSELSSELAQRRALAAESSSLTTPQGTLEMVHGQLERRHAERIRRRWFVIDGTNLCPAFLLVVLTGVVFWKAEPNVGNLNWFFPSVLLLQAASLAALLAYDLRIYQIAFGISVLALSVILGQWGGANRRELVARFLFAQTCGCAFVMLGFAMLVVAVPWMKIEDSPSLPTISWHIGTISYEIQKWTTGNELAFQYRNEVFPWILLILSLGFAIQFGLFPFHSWQVAVLSHVPNSLAVLTVAGLLSSCGIGWLRFVVPLAPELLAAFDWLILVPSLGAAIWGSLRALSPGEARQRAAFLFVSLSGVSLLGCFVMTRAAISGTWLMQQQLTVAVCGAMIAISPGNLRSRKDELFASEDSANSNPSGHGGAFRNLLLMASLPMLGLFASGFIIMSELLRESVWVTLFAFVAIAMILRAIFSLLNSDVPGQSPALSATFETKRFRVPMAVVLLLAAIVNLFPHQLLRQCEPDFLRIFRRFERPSTSVLSESQRKPER